jgi:vancomycin permeability regulator SanA
MKLAGLSKRAGLAAAWLALGATLILGGVGVDVLLANRAAARSVAENGDVRDAAIVPGSWVRRSGPGPILAARLTESLKLYRDKRVRKILVSGNGAAGEPAAMAKWLVEHGVPVDKILMDDLGTRTIETMRNAGATFGIETAFVCTQQLSMPRAIYLARASSIDAVPAPADGDFPHVSRFGAIETAKTILAVAETRIQPASHRATVLASER